VPITPLHGSLDAQEQDAALTPTGGPRIVLATNLAETTLTVADVTAVVDTGLHKVARYDADRAIDSLETEHVSQDSADQRAGRAGRVQAGIVLRLWDSRDRLRPHREPEIARIDLASVVLDVLGWGGRPRELDWFQAPTPGALDSAVTLLRRLGALDDAEALTPIGRVLRRLPLHPRLGRILIAGRAAPSIARACALLSERHLLPPRHGATACDLLSSVDADLPPHVMRVARELRDVARSALDLPMADRLSDEDFRRAIFAGYPDRLARRRSAGGDRFALATGTGARLARESGVVNAEFVVAVDVTSGDVPRGNAAAGTEALIRIATGVESEWIVPTSVGVEHRFDAAGRQVRAARVERYDELIIGDHAVAPDPLVAGEVLAAEYLRRGPTDADRLLLHRVTFAGLTIEFDEVARSACAGQTKLDDVDLEAALPMPTRRELARLAPRTLNVPSGREVPLDYRDGGVVVAAVRLQQLFGLADSPRLGPRQVPVTFELLAPSGRPVQVTSDLRGFWTRTYPEVRNQLRIRYPKHKWPETGC
jgi:ATP-dependent helicase HrpB